MNRIALVKHDDTDGMAAIWGLVGVGGEFCKGYPLIPLHKEHELPSVGARLTIEDCNGKTIR